MSEDNNFIDIELILTILESENVTPDFRGISMVSPPTVQEWVNEYQNGGLLERKSTKRQKKFSEYHWDWILSKLREDALLHKDELVQLFKAALNASMSPGNIISE